MVDRLKHRPDGSFFYFFPSMNEGGDLLGNGGIRSNRYSKAKHPRDQAFSKYYQENLYGIHNVHALNIYLLYSDQPFILMDGVLARRPFCLHHVDPAWTFHNCSPCLQSVKELLTTCSPVSTWAPELNASVLGRPRRRKSFLSDQEKCRGLLVLSRRGSVDRIHYDQKLCKLHSEPFTAKSFFSLSNIYI